MFVQDDSFICPMCQHEGVEDGACSSCGFDLTAEMADIMSKEGRCGFCGDEISFDEDPYAQTEDGIFICELC